MYKMRYIAPPPAVAGRQLNRVAEHRAVGLDPQVAQLVGVQLALLETRLVQFLLEAGHADLPEHRGEGVLDLAAQERELDFRLLLPLEQGVER